MKAFGLILSLLGASTAFAEAETSGTAKASAPAADYEVAFGPFVGGGNISSGQTVRNVNGYALSFERHWMVAPGLGLGPVLEAANAFVDLRSSGAGKKVLGTYDNRFVAAGFRLSHAVGNDHALAQSVYLTGLAGRGFSKLSVTESTETSTRQNDYGNIRGNFFSGELGAFLPLKGSFGINVAALGTQYRADQSAATGTYSGDETRDGILSLTQGSYPAQANLLERSVTMRAVAGKVGISLGF